MATWEPEGIDIADRDGLGEGYDNWDDDIVKDLELRFNKLSEFNETLNKSTNENTIETTEKDKNALTQVRYGKGPVLKTEQNL